MAPRKPTWDWKARACAEFENFTVAYAMKEYLQNAGGQVLKHLGVLEWSNWIREDLRDASISAKEREKRKQSLIAEYPGLLTGPHGAAVKRLKAWVPIYILSATIPRLTTTTDVKIAVVVWRHTTAEICAISVFNNHLDARAKFTSFTVDGSSTSRDNQWAVGEKGKGFILATQFLFETTEEYMSSLRQKDLEGVIPKDLKAAVSFRVGHQIGTLRWKKSRFPNEDDLLQVVLDDLTPYSVEEYMEKQAADARYKNRNNSDDEDDDDEDPDSFYGYTATAEKPKLRKSAETALKGIYNRRVTQQLDTKGEKEALNNRGRCLVASDEVAITVIGLDASFEPEYLFSAIYGIIPPTQAWRVPGSQVQFFIAPVDKHDSNADKDNPNHTKFYHRDQYVLYGLHLNKLSVNYHGDLNITSDRVAILRDRKITAYWNSLASAGHQAFKTMPDLALELALDVLSDEHSEGLVNLIRPPDTSGADGYRAAFDSALRKVHPELPPDARIHPTSGGAQPGLAKELGLTPVTVPSKVWDMLEKSGAYISINDYARQVLLEAPALPTALGLARLRRAMSIVAPNVPAESITIRDYSKSAPSVVWDSDNQVFAFARPPKCEDHPAGQCFCWVGPFLHDAASDYDEGKLSTRKLFRAYLLCMKGNANMEADEVSDSDDEQGIGIVLREDEDDRMDIDDGNDDRSQTKSDKSSDSSYLSSPLSARSPSPAQSDKDSLFSVPPDIRSTPTRRHKAQRAANKTAVIPDEPRGPSIAPVEPVPPPPIVAAPPPAEPVPPPPPAANPLPAANPFLPAPAAHAPLPPPNPLLPIDPEEEDAAVAFVSTLLTNNKHRRTALANAAGITQALQAEIAELKTRRNALEMEVDVLKIDCAVQKAELGRVGAEKDARIAALEKDVGQLKARIDSDEAELEEFLRTRKKPRTG
ncbi:hypothetical protein C8R43DRAFT_1041020 [Mycena crocata]|nr:hypothetical protein C8R43DRAFT_1041020 [Mycena crocata]